jgi:predicted metal-dependent phosphoesterase TrpH
MSTLPRIDLHTHTTASDGYLSPAALVQAAGAAGIQVLGVTDHDTMAALPEAAAHACRAGIVVVPGVELSAYWRRVELHILGYFVDAGDAALQAFLARTHAARLTRLDAMISRLWRLGIAVSAADVLAEARNGTVGRPHLARVLVRQGVVQSVDAAFDRYLATDRPAYVPRPDVSVADAIRVIREAGGVASLAHPGLHERDDALPDLLAAGLDAIEVYHPNHIPPKMARYRRLATSRGLLVTGGSDFHGGPDGGNGEAVYLGVPALPEADFRRLEAAAESRRAARS